MAVHRRAIVIFPPQEDMRDVESVRDRFDPLAAEVRAHVTLVFPFEADIPTFDLERHVENVTAGVAPFAIRFGPVASTDDLYMFLTFSQGASDVARLHDALYTGPLKRFLSPDTRFIPHITVGRAADAGDLKERLAIASGVDFGSGSTASAVSVYRIDPGESRRVEFEVALR